MKQYEESVIFHFLPLKNECILPTSKNTKSPAFAELFVPRNMYCFASITGLRYSDVVSLKHEHIKDKS